MTDEILRDYYRALQDRPLEPGDPAYIPLYAQEPLDPVAKLATTIEWASNESTQLFSGFRGSGKSTELLRLRKQLEGAGFQVVYRDMEDYLNTTTPVEIADFLLALAGALAEGLHAGPLRGHDLVKEGYWARFAAWMTRTDVQLTELAATAGAPVVPGGKATAGATLKASLKQDPTFKQKLQERMAGHLGALVGEVRAFVQECVVAADRAAPGRPLVLLLDSIEHIRGTAVNAEEVSKALVNLFFGHADKLRFPHLHVIYTVPPWLKIKEPGAAAGFDMAVQLPCVAVNDREGRPRPEGRRMLHTALRKRGAAWDELVSPADAEQLVAASGGHLRELLRLVREVAVRQRGRPSPAEAAVVQRAIQEIRGQYLPIADEDARWLARIAATHSAELPDQTRLPDLARYFDSLLVMTYNDGEEWWDVHPLVRDHVLRQAPPAAGAANPGA